MPDFDANSIAWLLQKLRTIPTPTGAGATYRPPVPMVFLAKITAAGTTGDGYYQATQIKGLDTSTSPATAIDLASPLVWDGAASPRHQPEIYELSGTTGLAPASGGADVVVEVVSTIDQNGKPIWVCNRSSDTALALINGVGSADGYYTAAECDASGTVIAGGKIWGGAGLPEIAAPGLAKGWHNATKPLVVVVRKTGSDWVILDTLGTSTSPARFNDNAGSPDTTDWDRTAQTGDGIKLHLLVNPVVDAEGLHLFDRLATFNSLGGLDLLNGAVERKVWGDANKDAATGHVKVVADPADSNIALLQHTDPTAASSPGLAYNFDATYIESVVGGLGPSAGTAIQFHTRTRMFDDKGHRIQGSYGGGDTVTNDPLIHVPVNLGDLDDVSATSPSSGDVLTFSGGSWGPGTAPSSGLTTCSTPADGDLFKWDASTGCLAPVTPVTVDVVTDVTLDTAAMTLTQTKKTLTVIAATAGTDSYIDSALATC